MKQLTISTHQYSHQLEDFAALAKDAGWLTTYAAGWNRGQFSINCRYKHAPAFAEGLMIFLTDITLQENPIYQHSPKLQDMAHDLRKTPLYTAGLLDLSNFLKHSRILHLEGYVTFRMSEYREKLDLMSYSLIKKMNLMPQD